MFPLRHQLDSLSLMAPIPRWIAKPVIAGTRNTGATLRVGPIAPQRSALLSRQPSG
jgi:hypothetical protein